MTPLTEIIRQNLTRFAQQAQQDNITLTFQQAESEQDLPMDSEAISHDINIMLSHLLSLTPENGKIELCVTRDNSNKRILSITNLGINLHAYTGILKQIVLPGRVLKNGPDSTRFEILLDTESTDLLNSMNDSKHHEHNLYLEIQNRLKSRFNGTPNSLDALKVNPVEAAFLARVNRIIQDNLSNVQFDVNRLAELMNMSRTQLFRRLKPIIQQSASGHIRSIRLQKAKELLETTEHRVSEVAFLTGFENLSHFTKVFVNEFGIKPSAFSKFKPTGQE